MGNDYSLLKACENGDIEKVKNLIDKGLDIDLQNSGGNTALLLASYHGYIEIVKLLVSKGAKLNLKNDRGYTALECAYLRKHKEIEQLLLNKGCTSYYHDMDKMTKDMFTILLKYEKPKKEIEDTPTYVKSLQCVSCTVNKRCIVFINCGHINSCNTCYKSLLNGCPECRGSIKNFKRVYIN